jgi:hypothetical protein
MGKQRQKLGKQRPRKDRSKLPSREQKPPKRAGTKKADRSFPLIGKDRKGKKRVVRQDRPRSSWLFPLPPPQRRLPSRSP